MELDEEFKPALELKVSKAHPAALFRSPLEVRNWFTIERVWLEELRNRVVGVPTDDPMVAGLASQLVQLIVSRFNQISQLIDARAGREQYEQVLQQYVGELNSRRLVHSRSRVGLFIEELAKADIWEAIRVLIAYCNVRYSPNQTDQPAAWARAASIALLVERGLYQKSPNFDGQFQSFATSWDQRFIDVETKQNEALTGQEVALQQFKEKADGLSSMIVRLSEQNAAALYRGESEMRALAETYMTGMTLQAPTTYWTRKRNGHRKAAAGWAAGFALVAALSGILVWQIWTLTVFPALQPAAVGIGVITPSVGVFLPTVAAGFLCVWVLRIISRQLLSNLSLGSDAAERVAMVETFLSLMQKPDHVKEQDRILILASLFRPASSSNDDATPPNWFDLLMQRVKPN